MDRYADFGDPNPPSNPDQQGLMRESRGDDDDDDEEDRRLPLPFATLDSISAYLRLKVGR